MMMVIITNAVSKKETYRPIVMDLHHLGYTPGSKSLGICKLNERTQTERINVRFCLAGYHEVLDGQTERKSKAQRAGSTSTDLSTGDRRHARRQVVGLADETHRSSAAEEPQRRTPRKGQTEAQLSLGWADRIVHIRRPASDFRSRKENDFPKRLQSYT